MQLTSPDNYFKYFSFRGFNYPDNVKKRLSAEYERLYKNSVLRDTDNHLGDSSNADLPRRVIDWRDSIENSGYESTDSAGFYWSLKVMAKYADTEHSLERHSVSTNKGPKVCYRSQAFWKASASVNLPGRIGDTNYRGLNGFDTRCCVYGSAISVLTEMRFPNAKGEIKNEKPESNQLRREV